MTTPKSEVKLRRMSIEGYLRIQQLFPKVHEDLPKLLWLISRGDSEETKTALAGLNTLLEKESEGDETTLALYRVCGHATITKAMRLYSDNVTVQLTSLQALDHLANHQRCKKIAFDEYTYMRTSLVALGAIDLALTAATSLANFSNVAVRALSLVEKLMDVYTFEELFHLKIMETTATIMKNYQSSGNVQSRGCDIFHKATKKCSGPNRTMFEGIQTVSLLGAVMERFKDEKVYTKADNVLQGILSIKSNKRKRNSL
ncbi:expressed unknown protein [Seminavis robusta]|uniref:Uncharacterized protein n=1 Tax=Seminavis robusta TaxID=568900 RepID=A0A9N8ED22_9STRA|nr:expressed unknown protein [Seminavis robusta]|eukprot:Sro970_g226400.1 n/a (258) ;mRNA; r:39978-40813